MNNGYGATLTWVMRHHVTTMVASLLVLVATGYMFGLVPKGFIPSEDTGQLLINTEGRKGFPTSRWCSTSSSWPRSSRKIPTSKLFLQRRRRRCGLDRQYRPDLYETQTALRTAGGLPQRLGLNPASLLMRIS